MKAQKKLNVVLIVLVIILVSIISFVGVYHLEKNQMVSMLPSYISGTNISGYRKVVLELSDPEAQTESETVELGEADLTENVTSENEASQEENAENVTNRNLADENATTNETTTNPSVSEE